jgi:hypothetical protein
MAKLYPQVLVILRTIHEQYHLLSDSWLNEEFIETIFPLEVHNALSTIFSIQEDLQTEALIQFFEICSNYHSEGLIMPQIKESIFFIAFMACKTHRLDYEIVVTHPRCFIFCGLISEFNEQKLLNEEVFSQILSTPITYAWEKSFDLINHIKISDLKHIDSIMYHPNMEQLLKLLNILSTLDFYNKIIINDQVTYEKLFNNIVNPQKLAEFMKFIEDEKYSSLVQEQDAVQTLSYSLSHEHPTLMLKTIAYLKSSHMLNESNLIMCFKSKRPTTLAIIIHLLHQNALLNTDQITLICEKNQLEKILILVSMLNFKLIDKNTLATIIHQIIMYSDWLTMPIIFNPFKHMNSRDINHFDFLTIFQLITTCTLSPKHKIKLIESYLIKTSTHSDYDKTELVLSAIPPTVSFAANKLYEYYQTQVMCPLVNMKIRNQLYDALRQLIQNDYQLSKNATIFLNSINILNNMFDTKFNIIDPNSQISLRDLYPLFYFAISDNTIKYSSTRIIQMFYQKTILDSEELLAPSMVFTNLISCLPPMHPCYITEIITPINISKTLLEVTQSILLGYLQHIKQNLSFELFEALVHDICLNGIGDNTWSRIKNQVIQQMHEIYLDKINHQPHLIKTYRSILSLAQDVPISSRSIKQFFNEDSNLTINLPFGL